jgi:drug/metabolite transporter (DMT)-like permease
MKLSEMLKGMFRGRIILSYVIVFSFFGVILGIGHAMHTDTEISGEWKEILLLLLGALIGAFSKVIDHWFKDSDKDKILIEKMSEKNNDEV